ncbi:MAG: carboxymuconolactone decarboxylase family protein [Actinobacteria bacterium]|nr:carboxymuconolactone decarboxylase family protein [Actinomycetota bacterium]
MELDHPVVPVDRDILHAIDAVWASLAEPGRWLTGAQRVAVAHECRTAADGRRGTSSVLTDHHRDLVAYVVHDPAGIQDVALPDLLGPAMSVDEYVELCAVAAKVVAIDRFCTGLGASLLPLPSPRPGEPGRRRPPAAADHGARVPMLDPEALAAEIGPGTYHVNVRRGHSLVPEEADLQIRLVEALYVPDLLAHGLAGRRGLDRAQIEAVATRVSTLNRCFYCSAGHAALLTMAAGEGSGDAVAGAAAGGGDGHGVEHGPQLFALVEALVQGRPTLEAARAAAAEVLTDEQLLGAIATTCAFLLLNRVSDTSGIPLDPMGAAVLADLPPELGLGDLPGAARTTDAPAP